MRVTRLTALFVVMATASANADDGLDRAAISDGVGKAKPKVAACGEKSQRGGTVRAKVQVGPDGKVTSATAEGSADPQLNACVAAVMKSITFKKTGVGGAFSYPFVFDTSGAGSTTPPANSGDLDSAAISEGVLKLKEKLRGCGDASKTGGTVKAKVQVSPAGKVTSASVDGAGDTALDACVVTVMKTATFKPSKNGASFTYPFVFATPTGAPPVEASRPSDDLDRAAISDAVAKLKTKIAACGDKSKASGTVKTKVKVAPDGTVASATAEGSGDPALDACVAGVMKAATFKKTAQGGLFQYPFVFTKK